MVTSTHIVVTHCSTGMQLASQPTVDHLLHVSLGKHDALWLTFRSDSYSQLLDAGRAIGCVGSASAGWSSVV